MLWLSYGYVMVILWFSLDVVSTHNATKPVLEALSAAANASTIDRLQPVGDNSPNAP